VLATSASSVRRTEGPSVSEFETLMPASCSTWSKRVGPVKSIRCEPEDLLSTQWLHGSIASWARSRGYLQARGVQKLGSCSGSGLST